MPGLTEKMISHLKGRNAMPLANYCRKCKAEVSVGESCPYCGAKLTKTGERLSFGVSRAPWRDWFSWNRLLRVGLPVWGISFLVISLAELCSGGTEALAGLFRRGFGLTMLWLLGGMLLLFLALLFCQGREKVHYILDKDGVSAYTYVSEEVNDLALYARFLTPSQAETLQEDEHALPGLKLVRRVILPWERMKRVKIWREGQTLLFFDPAYWQVLAVSCPVQEFPEAESWVRTKMKRFKTVRVLPAEREKVGKKAKKR